MGKISDEVDEQGKNSYFRSIGVANCAIRGNYGIGGHLICEYPNVEWLSNEDGLD